MAGRIEVIGLRGVPEVKQGDDLGLLIVNAARGSGLELMDHDIIVVTHVIVSKAEGRVLPLSLFSPSGEALELARQLNKDPRHVEAMLREAVRVVRTGHEVIITETRHGLICANSGVDLSNVAEGYVALLPLDPDASARRVRSRIRELTGRGVAVIIADSHGRPFRRGAINIAIGCSGIEPIWDRRGERDRHGRALRSKQICIADELASAAELVMGQAGEGVPAAVIRGYEYRESDEGARKIIRPEDERLF